MRRREFITLIGGVAASFPRAVRAQQPAQIRRIGALMAAAVETDQQAGLAVFEEILHQLGWIDGRNVRVEVRWAGAAIPRRLAKTRKNWSHFQRTLSW